MKRLQQITLLLAASLCIGACTDGERPATLPTADEAALHFRIAPLEQAGNTRLIDPADEDKTGVDTDNPLKNVWVFQFAGTGDLAVLKKIFPRVDVGNITPGNNGNYNALAGVTLLPDAQMGSTQTSNGSVQTLLLIANVPVATKGMQADWGFTEGTTTLPQVLAAAQTIFREVDLYSPIDGVKTLTMSGLKTSDRGTAGFLSPANVVPLKRNVAKLTLTLKVDKGGAVVNNIQVCKVPALPAWGAAAAVDLTNPAIYPTPKGTDSDIAVLNLFAEESANMPVAGGDSVVYTWYVPANMRGVNTLSTSRKTKRAFAPATATYIQLNINEGNDSGSVFLYPGANNINDYNLRPNTHYKLNFTLGVHALESPDDSRLDSYTIATTDYTTRPLANCYMAHPAPKGSGIVQRYRIPVERVKEYWTQNAAGYGKMSKNPLINAAPWSAKVLWSDIQSITPSTVISTSGAYTSDGNLSNDYFSFDIPAGTPSGNFVVAVTDKSNNILWSWHIWVTDYQPDQWIDSGQHAAPGDVYAVHGGQVESYAGCSVWEHPTGMLYGKVMMDRMLGAVSRYPATLDDKTRGILHYQYGRKDPFPAAPVASGVTISTVGDQGIIADAVLNPTRYYTGDNWCSDTDINDNLNIAWNDANARYGDKSIYDPCPPGWQLPLIGTWNGFTNTGDGGGSEYADGSWSTHLNADNRIPPTALKWSGGSGIATPGLRYWHATSQTAVVPAGKVVYYEPAGWRDPKGNLSNITLLGNFWSATPFDHNKGLFLDFSFMYIFPQTVMEKSAGFSVRCAQE
ncbi:MAG: hypothetical protein LBL97_08245 [Prevotellaceae bacterium]|jgi:hypothetical protein|nr:hypothetical protein [Prevotellaceae bacterium]